MEKHQKEWQKPQLIVLAQGTPEESVLRACKTMNPNVPGVQGANGDFDKERCSQEPTNCGACDARPAAGT